MKQRRALVLSAGGYFGAYQAGVWKALEHRMKIDLVVGASVGALNGWSIASGCSGDELAERWLHPSTAGDLTLVDKPGWRTGYFQQEPLLQRAEKLVREDHPKLPYGLVTVELPWLEARLVQTEAVTARHLLATCSIPIVMPFVTINGRRFTDGGLIHKLPLWAAVKMGATEILAVDALPLVAPWWARAGGGVLRALRKAPAVPENIGVTVLSPSQPLGDMHDAVIWKRENVERWINLGKQDAVRMFALQ